MKTIPFTYHICWTKENLHYYGVRYAQGTTPGDLWTKYHTSSDRVKDLKESLGDPDIIEVRKIFDAQEEAINWEHRVLKRLGVIQRDDWINEACWPAIDNRGTKNPFFGKIHTDKTKEKIANSLLGNVPWNKGQICPQLSTSSFLGKKHTDETKKKMSESSKGIVPWNKGIPRSEETKRKISESLKNKMLR